MRKYILTLAAIVCSVTSFAAINAQHSFEDRLPAFLRVNGRGSIELSTEKYKDGKSSVKFNWNGPVQLMFTNGSDIEASMKADGGGMILWIYNTAPISEPLLFKFHDKSHGVICQFNFNMDFTGWRTMWIKYEDMLTPDGRHLGEIPLAERNTDASRMTVTVPQSCQQGTIYLDRLSFMQTRMQDQIVPDKQIPENNFMLRSRLWQWGQLWRWEQYPEPELKAVNADQAKMLRSVEERMDAWAATGNPGAQYTQSTLIPRANDAYAKYGIKRLTNGGITGAPLLYDDEFPMRCSYIR